MSIPGIDIVLDMELHKLFADVAAEGEWFTLGPAQVAWLFELACSTVAELIDAIEAWHDKG